MYSVFILPSVNLNIDAAIRIISKITSNFQRLQSICELSYVGNTTISFFLDCVNLNFMALKPFGEKSVLCRSTKQLIGIETYESSYASRTIVSHEVKVNSQGRKSL